jgi:hypothetical protein
MLQVRAAMINGNLRQRLREQPDMPAYRSRQMVRNVLPPTRMNPPPRTALSVARMRMAHHARALLDQLHSIAIAADALVKTVVFSSDLAVEVRGGATLRGAGVGDGLSCRSQIK